MVIVGFWGEGGWSIMVVDVGWVCETGGDI